MIWRNFVVFLIILNSIISHYEYMKQSITTKNVHLVIHCEYMKQSITTKNVHLVIHCEYMEGVSLQRMYILSYIGNLWSRVSLQRMYILAYIVNIWRGVSLQKMNVLASWIFLSCIVLQITKIINLFRGSACQKICTPNPPCFSHLHHIFVAYTWLWHFQVENRPLLMLTYII